MITPDENNFQKIQLKTYLYNKKWLKIFYYELHEIRSILREYKTDFYIDIIIEHESIFFKATFVNCLSKNNRNDNEYFVCLQRIYLLLN